MKQYDILIVGAGPAGMTAALYAARAGKSVVLVEGETYGGQIVESRLVENYPGAPNIGGVELAEAMMQPLRELAVEVAFDRVEQILPTENGFSVRTGNGEDVMAHAVILATGVGHRRLNVPGEDAFIGRGVSFCATCDGRFFKGREVAVVGGGNTAAQDALELSALCKRVWLIHRREGFRAEPRLLERVRATENIEIVTDTVVESINGEFALQSVTVRNVKTDERREIAVAGVFEAVGNLPRNGAFAELVDLDGEGYIVTDNDMKTSRAGVFAAGDCRQKRIRQLTTATSDGTVAALSAIDWLS